MQSHTCEFNVSECAWVLARPLVPVAMFALAMHLGARWSLLPDPRPTLDVDRTILIHKAEASCKLQDSQVLLVGDSSCLMDVSALELSRRLARPVLNLGTISYLTPVGNALLLSNYCQANPGQLRTVVLLMHPEALRLSPGFSWQEEALRSFLQRTDFEPGEKVSERVAGLLGVHIFSGRVLARLVPRPLPGAFGKRYGFSDDLENCLRKNRGSAVDPERKPAEGVPEYRLADYFKSASFSYRQAVPPGVVLCVGITPLPESFAGDKYPAVHAQMLRLWGECLQADVVLTNLPAVLADELFAQKAHLNEHGQHQYTECLARALNPRPPE